MDERCATELAAIYGGEAVHSGGNHWIVRIEKPDGSVVVMSDGMIAEYAGEQAYHDGVVLREIELA